MSDPRLSKGGTMTTHLQGLTPTVVKALRAIDAEGKTDVTLGATTATWESPAERVLEWLDEEMAALPSRGFPRHSLHAVRRRLEDLASQERAADALAQDLAQPEGSEERAAAEALIADEPIDPNRPAVGEQFQIRAGYGYDDEIFRVIEYHPFTGPPEKIQELYRLPELPLEAVECWKLERHDGAWVGVQRHAFPTAIMVPVGSTARAFSAVNGGTRKPRARSSSVGTCEHCGQPTKGGRFIPGHDAKLKGDLVREGTDEAMAERLIRGWATDASVPAAVTKLVKQGDGFLRSRIAARTGTDPGREER